MKLLNVKCPSCDQQATVSLLEVDDDEIHDGFAVEDLEGKCVDGCGSAFTCELHVSVLHLKAKEGEDELDDEARAEADDELDDEARAAAEEENDD